MAPEELTGLMSFRPFLTMEMYYKNAALVLNFSGGKKTLKVKAVPTI